MGRFDVSQLTLSAADNQQEALLVPAEGNRFGICVDPTPAGGWAQVRPSLRSEIRRHRFRFRVAHEIAHTFFYDRTMPEPQRTLPPSTEEELFCDEFARSLLLPPAVVRRRAATAASVFSMHRDFDVSVEVAARAIAGACPSLRVAVWYQDPDGGWCVQWTNRSSRRQLDIRHQAGLKIHRGRRQAVAVAAPRSATRAGRKRTNR